LRVEWELTEVMRSYEELSGGNRLSACEVNGRLFLLIISGVMRSYLELTGFQSVELTDVCFC
jgi:hypothetical protein